MTEYISMHFEKASGAVWSLNIISSHRIPIRAMGPLRMMSQLNYTPTTSEVHAGEKEKSNFFLDGAIHNRFSTDY